ncbi:MAG: PocR ligand-binding domain-containing protein [Synergistaceae bacterium]|nr:PocR ligand-binding domain-containing protein [Synergistaceae bacterium]
MDEIRDIRNIIKIEVLQSIQDQFAEATGISFVSVDYRGHPITRMSGFTDFCKMMRADENLCQRCFRCDAHGGLNATITGKPFFYYCHTSLVDFAVPLFLKGSFMGAVLCGQVKVPQEDEAAAGLEDIIKPSPEWRENPEMAAAYDKINVVPFSKIKSVALLMQKMLQYMIDEEYKNIVTEELGRKQQELAEEKNRRIYLEEALKVRRFFDFQNRYGLDFIFYILNVISKLAYQEHALETENTVCDFSDMMRYLFNNSHSRFVSLEDELKYFSCFAAIQKRRLDGNLEYEISVPRKYYSVPCPFTLMHAVLENIFKYNCDIEGKARIHVSGKESGGAFLLTVSSRGIPFDGELLGSGLDFDGAGDGYSDRVVLSVLNRRLKALFGESYGIFLKKSADDGGSGVDVQIKLPLSSSGVAE